MKFRLLALVTAMICLSSNLFAQHNDVEFGYDDVANPSEFILAPLDFDIFTQDGILLVKTNMEIRDPFMPNDFSGDQPGFATNRGLTPPLQVNPGDFIMINVLDATAHSAFGVGFVNFYNPTTDSLEASGRLALEDNTLSTPDLVMNGTSIESGVTPQFIGVANSSGDVHDHVVFDLLDDSTAPMGAYGVLVQLQSDFAPIDGNMDLSSDPFWVVFNHGLTTSEFDQALEKFGVGAEVESVTPESWTVAAGTHVSGGVSELSESDNQDLSVQRNTSDLASRVFLEFESTLLTPAPASLEFSVEASVFARSTVVQVIELWDFDTGSWEQIDTRNASRFLDSTVTIELSGDVARFVEPGTQAVRSRIKFTSGSQRQRFTANVDQIVWTFER